MDPNVALTNIRRALVSAQRQMDADTDDPSFCVVRNGTVSELIEAVSTLDAWLSGDGFPPSDWTGKSTQCRPFLMCENEATTTVDVGPIAVVAACQSCANQLNRADKLLD